mmetsp:Transcript_23922/g.37461  ORF Transcript_23922/g.37461 Transcript_23922/m.37461 type:complete len:141 (-) Transcript_23922:1597-2019(-)
MIQRALPDHDLSQAMLKAGEDTAASFDCVLGLTMTTDDFYCGQGRLDGALAPWYSADDRLAFLRKAQDLGVKNIEMEAACMLAFCRRAKVKAACLAVTLLDRLKGDQVTSTGEELRRFQGHAITVLGKFLKQELQGAFKD